MNRLTQLLLLFVFIASYTLTIGCKKETLLTNGGSLKFSVDTLKFDTVFTAVGSFTTFFKIYNPQNQPVVVSSVRLQKGDASFFKLNVDGFPGSNVTNLKIAAHDSMYVFATVKIDPTDTSVPFIVKDNLIATLNGKDYTVPFTAYGQNAHYIVDSVLEGNVTWVNDKPYVIVSSAAVDKGASLTLLPGVRVYMNADSRLVVLGKLIAKGTKKDSIIFQGDRLDRSYFGYEGYPGEWGGLYFGSHSKGSQLDYVKLLNGGNTALSASPAAIQTYIDSEKDASNIQLTMNHTVIQNSIGYGILSYGGTIHARNCLVTNTGAQALALVQGGNYLIENCTFANYPTNKINHIDNSTAIILNYYAISSTQYIPGDLNATLRNCIVWGTLSTELSCDSLPGATANITIDHCIYKADSMAAFVRNQNKGNANFMNVDPLFVDYTKWQYQLKANSPAIGAGVVIPFLNDDLDGNTRSGTNDIGCYQFQP